MQAFAVPAGQLELWFEFGSPYSYLSVMRAEALARRAGVQLLWKPVLLGPIFKALGWAGSPFLEQKEKMAYMWRDMARLCARYGLPWRQPSAFPRNGILPLRIATAFSHDPWLPDFCKAVMRRNFADDAEIAAEEDVVPIIEALGLPVAGVLRHALAEENKLALRRQTEEAQQRGLFGGPTFFAGDQMFWGDDRLEQAIEWASDQARAAPAPLAG